MKKSKFQPLELLYKDFKNNVEEKNRDCFILKSSLPTIDMIVFFLQSDCFHDIDL